MIQPVNVIPAGRTDSHIGSHVIAAPPRALAALHPTVAVVECFDEISRPTEGPSPVAGAALVAGVRRLPLELLTRDPTVTPRSSTHDTAAVTGMVTRLKDGAPLPPLVAFHDRERQTLWLSDGFRRYEAYCLAGETAAEVEVRPGDLRDAQFYAIVANSKTGTPLTVKEKKTAAKRLLDDPEWSRMSSVKIAAACGLSDKTVQKLKDAARPRKSEDVVECERNGKRFTMRVASRTKPGPACTERPTTAASASDAALAIGPTSAAADASWGNMENLPVVTVVTEDADKPTSGELVDGSVVAALTETQELVERLLMLKLDEHVIEAFGKARLKGLMQQLVNLEQKIKNCFDSL